MDRPLGGGPLPGPPRRLQGVKVVAGGLQFPEGPVVLEDGTVLLVEIHRGTVSHVDHDGKVSVVGECGRGSNGLALGPDGMAYVCNHGGTWPDYRGGSVQRVDLVSGVVDVLYRECGDVPLSSPNDLVFDSAGGFWFTDAGKKKERIRDSGRIYYATPDGTSITPAIDGVITPNGIGLSPDEDVLYFVETYTARAYRAPIAAPGRLEAGPSDPIHSTSGCVATHTGTLMCGLPGLQEFDSLAVDHHGNVCVATLLTGCVTVVAPDSSWVQQWVLPDELFDLRLTNLCFGGQDGSTAYITLSQTGLLVQCEWPYANDETRTRAGLPAAVPNTTASPA
jgi:gluconolactonase